MKICMIENCNKKHYGKGYCQFHYQRSYHKRPFNLPFHYKVEGWFQRGRKTGFTSGESKGEKNVNWKGGISEYPNHYQMKQIRKQRLIEENYICQICQGKANQIHHVDKTKTNHDPNNFMVLCQKCHISNFHRQKRQTSKFIRLYGKTINDLAINLNFSSTWIFHLHKKDLLKNLLLY